MRPKAYLKKKYPISAFLDVGAAYNVHIPTFCPATFSAVPHSIPALPQLLSHKTYTFLRLTQPKSSLRLSSKKLSQSCVLCGLILSEPCLRFYFLPFLMPGVYRTCVLTFLFLHGISCMMVISLSPSCAACISNQRTL